MSSKFTNDAASVNGLVHNFCSCSKYLNQIKNKALLTRKTRGQSDLAKAASNDPLTAKPS